MLDMDFTFLLISIIWDIWEMNPIFLLIISLTVILSGYFFPFLVAWGEGHKDKIAIGKQNLFWGWTFVGWVRAWIRAEKG